MSDADRNTSAGLRRIPVRLVLFGVVAVAAFAVGFLTFSVGQSRVLVLRYGYYTISLTFAWALYALYRVAPSIGESIRAISGRERWHVVGIVSACTVVAVLTVPIGYKILYDEMVLQATAADLHLFREVSTVMRAYMVDGVFVPLDTYVDKRPFFFAYLVSLLHDIAGYREGNAFALNIALMPCVLLQVYVIARRVGTHVAALAAVLALGTLSTLAHSATSAGMEMLNLAMLLLCVQLAIYYLDSPDEPHLAALALAVVLLAQTRYESSLYVGSVALVVLEGWRRAGRIVLPAAAVLTPALLIPYAVHNTYLSGTPLLWELKENEKTRFAIEHLLPNLRHAYGYFFDSGSGLTNSLWLSTAGFGAAGFSLWMLWRHRREWRTAPSAAAALIAFGLGVVGNLGLLMFYYWGQLDDPTVSRLVLPFSFLLATAVAFAVGSLNASRLRLGWVAAGGAVLAYFWSGLVANAQHSRRNTLGDELAWERRYVEALPPGERLIITNKSSLPWTLDRVSSISIDRARRRVDALKYQLANHNFREILVSQSYRPTSAAGEFLLDPIERLPDWFVLEPIAERRFGARLDRISRLVAINNPEPGSVTEKKPDAGAKSKR